MSMRNREIVQYTLSQSAVGRNLWRENFVKDECLVSGMKE